MKTKAAFSKQHKADFISYLVKNKIRSAERSEIFQIIHEQIELNTEREASKICIHFCQFEQILCVFV